MFEINNHPGVRTKWTTTSLILESTACFDRSRPLISSDTSETLMIWSYNAGYDWSRWMLQLMITIDLFSLYVLFSHFRPRDGKFPPMREHPRVYVCRFNLTVYILHISRAIFTCVFTQYCQFNIVYFIFMTYFISNLSIMVYSFLRVSYLSG